MYPEQTAIPKAPWEIPQPPIAQVPRGPEVKSQLERLSAALANLEDTAAFLGQRLEFVLTPDAPAMCAQQPGLPAMCAQQPGLPAPIRSDMAAAVDLLEQRVQSVNRMLNSLMDRLEV